MDYVDIIDERSLRSDTFLNKHIKILERLILKNLMIKTWNNKSKYTQDFISTRPRSARVVVTRDLEPTEESKVSPSSRVMML